MSVCLADSQSKVIPTLTRQKPISDSRESTHGARSLSGGDSPVSMKVQISHPNQGESDHQKEEWDSRRATWILSVNDQCRNTKIFFSDSTPIFCSHLRVLRGPDFQKWVSTCFLKFKNTLKCFKLEARSQGSQEGCTIRHICYRIGTQVRFICIQRKPPCTGVHNPHCCDTRLNFIIILLLTANKRKNYPGHFLKKQLIGFLCLHNLLI